MTEKKFHLIKNCETQEETLVEFTAEEYAQAELDAAALAEAEAQRQAEAEALAALKAAAILKLTTGQPLTAEEAGTIVL